jgi:hypothetical protein
VPLRFEGSHHERERRETKGNVPAIFLRVRSWRAVLAFSSWGRISWNPHASVLLV